MTDVLDNVVLKELKKTNVYVNEIANRGIKRGLACMSMKQQQLAKSNKQTLLRHQIAIKNRQESQCISNTNY